MEVQEGEQGAELVEAQPLLPLAALTETGLTGASVFCVLSRELERPIPSVVLTRQKHRFVVERLLLTFQDCPGCKQDCVWDDWKSWSACSAGCGGGKRNRTREVLTPKLGSGKECSPPSLEEQVCNTQVCTMSWLLTK